MNKTNILHFHWKSFYQKGNDFGNLTTAGFL